MTAILSRNSPALPYYRVGSDGEILSSATGTASDPTNTQAAPLPAGTDRSGSAGTAVTVLAPANASRRGLEIQNISANTLGINEIGGTAALNSAGTYTIGANGTFRVRTNRAISVIASAAASAYTATEY